MPIATMIHSLAGIARRLFKFPCAFVAVLAILTGCQAGLNVRSPFESDAFLEQRALAQFERPDIDYATLVHNRAEVRAITANHGYGTLEPDDAPLTVYLNHVLAKLTAASPVPELSARVLVVDTVDSPVVSAFHDGTIYVPLRLLDDMNNAQHAASEDALAFMLAHELAHIMSYHYSSGSLGTLFSAGVVGVDLFIEGANLVREISGKSAISDKKSKDLRRKFAAAKTVEEVVISPSWTRSQEQDADLFGFDLMIKAGYNPDAAYEFLDFLHGYETEAERIRKERESADVHAPEDIQGLFAAILKDAVAEMSRTHVTVAARRETLNKYHERWEDEVWEAEEIEVRRVAWHPDASKEVVDEHGAARIRQVFLNYDEAKAARRALADGEYRKAELHVRQSLSAPTQYNAYPRIIAAKYAAHTGDDDAAIGHLRTALEQGPGPSFLVYRRLLVQLVRQRNYSAVGELLDDAESRFGRNVELARWKATILEMQGQGAIAEKVRSQCVSDNILQLNEKDRCLHPVELI
jgi:hypothetical protein